MNLANDLRLDLVPSRLIEGKLPNLLVHNFIHWYDHETGRVLFCPRNAPWPSPDNGQHWHLEPSNSSWRMMKGKLAMIDPLSGPAQVMSALFISLDDPLYIHFEFNTISRKIEVELPRLQLDFMVDESRTRVYSRQYRGMFLDDDQDPGTLTGLYSKLVLRGADSSARRMMLIPEGKFHYIKTHNHHISVKVENGTVERVHAYTILAKAQRLVDSGNLQSKLILCYLHALTSYCLPDQLTGCTGTESAFSILRSAGVRSFEYLESENIATLLAISRLSPIRNFFPDYEKAMQRISWDKQLPALSQHFGFLKCVIEIFEQANQTQFLYPKKNLLKVQVDRNAGADSSKS